TGAEIDFRDAIERAVHDVADSFHSEGERPNLRKAGLIETENRNRNLFASDGWLERHPHPELVQVRPPPLTGLEISNVQNVFFVFGVLENASLDVVVFDYSFHCAHSPIFVQQEK